MLYIVSGDGPRCGSSMMMHALCMGGMGVAYEQEQEQEGELQVRPGYTPNEHKFYELSMSTMQHPGFPWPELDGLVVKMFPWPWSPFCGAEVFSPAYGYEDANRRTSVLLNMPWRVLWLHRPYETRMKSFRAAHANVPLGMLNDGSISYSMKWRHHCAEAALEMLREFFSDWLTEMDYDDILADPRGSLGGLDWPFDLDAAVKTIDPSLKRF